MAHAGERVGAITLDEPVPLEEMAAAPGGPSRRQLLVGAVGLAAGGAAWWFNQRREPARERVAVSGPEPHWTYRGPGPHDGERVDGRGALPVLLTGAAVHLLSPDSGAVLRQIPKDRHLLAAEGLLYRSQPDRIAVIGLGPDRVVPVPAEFAGSGRLLGADGELLLGSGGARGDLFALSARTGAVRWTRPAEENGGLLEELYLAPGGRLLARSSRDEVVALNREDGSRLWVRPTDQALSWLVSDADSVYTARRANGVQAFAAADGRLRWVVESEDWRPIRPVAANGAVYLLRDSGEVTRNIPADGQEVWSCRLPFRLDGRCLPVLVGGTLFVPGPFSAGVCAVDTATGAVRWTFRDAEPGVQAWRVTTDGERLYAGHDRVLHSLPVG